VIKVEAPAGTLERSFPRINAGASTTNPPVSSLTQTLKPDVLSTICGTTKVVP